MRPLLISLLMLSVISCMPGMYRNTTMTDYLPRDTDVPGWTRLDVYQEPMEAVDGLKEYTGARYSSLSDEGEAVIKGYRFDSVKAALAWFTAEDGTVQTEEGWYHKENDGSAMLFAGTFVFSAEGALREDFKSIMKTRVAELSPVSENWQEKVPSYLYALGEKNLQGLRYYHGAYPYVEAFPEGAVERTIDGITVFYRQVESTGEALQIFNRFIHETMVVKRASSHIVAYYPSDNGYVCIAVSGNWLYGVREASSGEEGYKACLKLQEALTAAAKPDARE